MQNKLMTFLSMLSIAPLLSQELCAVSKKSLKCLAPAGQAILNQKRDNYPQFNVVKVSVEAKKKYPMLDIGKEIFVTYKRNQAKGKFYGIEGRYAKIGYSKVPLIDLSPDILSKLSKKENSLWRKQYIKREKTIYYQKRKYYLNKLADELYVKYPKLKKFTIECLFRNIDDKAKRKAYIADFLTFFESRLPIQKSISDAIEVTLKAFIRKTPELLFQKGRLIDRATIEARKKAAEEKEKKRLAKIDERIVFPKTTTPVFEPDGGKIKSGETLKITCSTKGAVIHYTLDGTTPDINSPVYNKPIPMKGMPPEAKAIAIHPEYNDSDIASHADFMLPNGLLRTYFCFLDFTGPYDTQIDRTINFKWGVSEKPSKSIPWCMNSALWTGQIQPEYDEKYTLYLKCDDAARLWINGKLIMSSWREQGPTEIKKTLKLKAGRKYHIKIAFAELFGAALLKLEWSSTSTPRQVVPASALYPNGKYTDIVKKWCNAKDKTYLVNPGALKGQYKLILKKNNFKRLNAIYSMRIEDSQERSKRVAAPYDLRKAK